MEKRKQIYVRNKMNRKIKKNRFFSINIRNEIIRIFLLLLSIISIIVGCLIYKNAVNIDVNNYINNTIIILCDKTFISIFTLFLKYELVFILLSYFIGSSYLGAPLVVFIPIIKCLFIGYLSSYMYNEHQLSGVLFCLTILYPYFAISTSTLIYGINESIKMSKLIYDCTAQKNTANENFIKLYFFKYLIIIFITIVCTAINSLIATFLANKIIHL